MFQLPILDNSTKLKIPVKPLIRKKHDIRKRRFLVTTNAIEFGKCLSKSTAPTPQMMPKPNSIPSTNLENDGFRESWSALSCGSKWRFGHQKLDTLQSSFIGEILLELCNGNRSFMANQYGD